MDRPKREEGLALSDKFGVAFVAGWVSALAVAICSMFIFGWSWSSMPLALLVLVFSAPVFIASFFLKALVFQRLFDHLVRNRMFIVLYAVCLILGSIIAFGLVQLFQNPGRVMELISALSGLIGGVFVARFWSVVYGLRQSYPATLEAKGKILFFPSWISGAKQEQERGHP